MASSISSAGVLGYGLQVAVGVIFLTAAISKLIDFSSFRKTVAEYAVLPRSLTTPTAYVISILEGAAGLALLTGFAAELAVGLALALLGSFAVGISVNLRRGRRIPCGCFGGARDTITARSLARIGLVTLALLAARFVIDTSTPAPAVLTGGAESWQHGVEVAAIAAFTLAAGMWVLALPELLQAIGVRRRPDRIG
jgi:uncharacterized membrane protein YphA (DoxX/SURF4 family)